MSINPLSNDQTHQTAQHPANNVPGRSSYNANNTTTIQHLPQDCTTKIVVLSGDAPNCAKVCRGWYNAAAAAYPLILEIYRENKNVRFFIPKAFNLDFEAVTQTYRNVMDSTYGTHSQAKADVLQLNLHQRLALHPVLEIAKDASLVQLFKVVASLLDTNQIPALKGDLAQQGITIRDWMKNHQTLLDPIEYFSIDDEDDIPPDFCKLTVLPPEISTLKNLRSLYLKNNKLTALPKEIFQLPNLALLDFSNNLVPNLSTGISLLTNLEVLDLSKNLVSDLPPEIGLLTNLKRLFCRNNQITNLPTEVFRLPHLSVLSFPDNLVSGLPSEISRLTSLEDLSFHGNPLTTLPPEIGQLTKLQALALNNQLTALPAQIDLLRNLKCLYLSCIDLIDLREPLQAGTIAHLYALDKIIGALRAGKNQEAAELFNELPVDIKTEIVRQGALQTIEHLGQAIINFIQKPY